MICPIIEVSFRIAKPGETPLDTECLKEDCAWWSSKANACAVMITAGSLAGLVAIGDSMLEKMPHEEQFRK